MRAALSTLRQLLAPRFDELPDPACDRALAVWVNHWRSYPCEWRLALRHLTKAAVADPAQYERLSMVARGTALTEAAADFLDEDDKWLCMDCGKEFPRRAGLLAHQAKLHGRRLAARRYVVASTCPACGTDFHARLRCLQHMTRAKACRAAWQTGTLVECDPTAVAEADDLDRLCRRSARRLGVSYLAGPPPKRTPAPVIGA